MWTKASVFTCFTLFIMRAFYFCIYLSARIFCCTVICFIISRSILCADILDSSLISLSWLDHYIHVLFVIHCTHVMDTCIMLANPGRFSRLRDLPWLSILQSLRIRPRPSTFITDRPCGSTDTTFDAPWSRSHVRLGLMLHTGPDPLSCHLLCSHFHDSYKMF